MQLTLAGLEVFHKVVLPHLLNSGVKVDHEITEKTGANSLEEIARRLDFRQYDAVLVFGGDTSLNDIVNGIWERCGRPNPRVDLPTLSTFRSRLLSVKCYKQLLVFDLLGVGKNFRLLMQSCHFFCFFSPDL